VVTAALDRANYLRAVTSERVLAAYTSYRAQLQLLTFQLARCQEPDQDQKKGQGQGQGPEAEFRGAGATRWVLKCPLHIMFIRELAQAFPEAKLVW
jgi:hypothetical protein